MDTALATSMPQVFAAGNLVHAAETADIAALAGRHAARSISAALRDGPRPNTDIVPVRVAAPLAWIAPNAIRSPRTPPPGGRFVLRSEVFARRARLEVRQNDRILASARVRLAPGRPCTSTRAGWPGPIRPRAPSRC